ncbi:MAG: hypothetical protein ACOY4K_05995 [Pseudomonadota bacterium]
MTDPMQTLKDDIAFMRALAQEGAGAPLLGGSILVAAGLIFSAASVLHWAMLTGLLALSPWAFPVIWFGALGIFLGALWLLNRRIRGRPGASRPGNRATGVAWAAAGWAIFTIGVSLMIVSVRARTEAPMLVFPSLILGLYGLGWSVAAAMSGKGWLWATAIGAYGATLLVAWFAIDPAVYLIYAAALVLLAAVPGFVLMRQEPAETI